MKGIDLQGLFDKTLDRAPYECLADVLVERLRASGTTVTQGERAQIVDQLQTGRLKLIRRRSWKIWDRPAIPVSVSDQDLLEVQKRLEHFDERVGNIALDMIQEVSPRMSTLIKKAWFEEGLAKERKGTNDFENKICETWHEPLELLWLIIDLASRCAENLVRLSQEHEPTERHRRDAMIRLHTRGVRVSQEILTLLRNGHADGAAARWRTLHETTVTAAFIGEHGDECAQRYLEHDAVELHRALETYELCREKLGWAPIPPDEIAVVEREYNDAIARFGREFKTDYGWAAPFVKRSKPNAPVGFVDIEAAVDFSAMRFDYRLATHEVHAGSRSLMAHLGLIEENMLLGGPSMVGLSQPGSNTARSLILLTATCSQVHPILDAFVCSYVMMLLGEEAHTAFGSVEDKLAAEVTSGALNE